jgi:hypothetical protein
MLKKLLAKIFIIVLVFINQDPIEIEFCDTLLNEEQINYELAMQEIPSDIDTSPDRIITLAITAHIIEKNNGTGGISESEILGAVENMNEKYASVNLRFEVCNFNYIKKNRFYYFNKNDEEKLTRNNVDSTINIYFVQKIFSSEEGNICGYTYYPTKNLNHIIMSNQCVGNTTTLPHEMGHYFGLYHTHEDKFGVELVNGSNCVSAGDLICDTPADPGLKFSNVNEDCEYIGLFLDPVKAIYNPPVDNIMSYSRKGCRASFTPMQADKMRQNYFIFKTHLKTLNIDFDASENFIAKGTPLTLKAAGGFKYIWNTGDTTQQITVTPDSSQIYSVNIYTNENCNVYKQFKAEVIGHDILVADKFVCAGQEAKVGVKNSDNRLSYTLRKGKEIIDIPRYGNDSTLVFQTGPLHATTKFNLVVTDPESGKVFTINKPAIVKVIPRPDTLNLQFAYKDSICIGSQASIKLTNAIPGLEYQLIANEQEIGSPIKAMADTLVLHTPILTTTQSFDLKIFNQCHSSIKHHAFVVHATDATIPKFKIIAEKQSIASGGETRVKIFPTSKNFTYQLVHNNMPVGPQIQGNGKTISFPTGTLMNNSEFCIYAYNQNGCGEILNQSIKINIKEKEPFVLNENLNNELSVKYHLERPGDVVSFEVYDLKGKKIMTFYEPTSEVGSHMISLKEKTKKLPPNNYMLKMSINGQKVHYRFFSIKN